MLTLAWQITIIEQLNPPPNDIDIFLVMAETLDVKNWGEETRAVFAHAQAQSRFGASVF